MRQERLVISAAGDNVLFTHSVILTHVNGWLDMISNSAIAPVIKIFDCTSIATKPSDPVWTIYPEHSKNTEQGVYFDIDFGGSVLMLKGLLVEIGALTDANGEMFFAIR